jgi:hypothetical protein
MAYSLVRFLPNRLPVSLDSLDSLEGSAFLEKPLRKRDPPFEKGGSKRNQ